MLVKVINFIKGFLFTDRALKIIPLSQASSFRTCEMYIIELKYWQYASWFRK